MVAESALAGPAALDQALQTQIVARLRGSSRPALRRLQVSVVGGRITLGGSVPSYYDKQLALQSCLGSGTLIDSVEVQ